MATRLWNPVRRPLEAPLCSLVFWFVCWKSILLLVAFLSPGPGYDTSALVLLRSGAAAREGDKDWPSLESLSPNRLDFHELLAVKLLRWDAIYFATAARRGHFYEQEWAFSWVYARLISLISQYFFSPGSGILAHVWTATAVSHISHLFSVLVLYCLAAWVRKESSISSFAFTAAILHIVSPAGIFLSAPYGESLFSFLNVTGFLFYSYQVSSRTQEDVASLSRDAFLLAAGGCFGLATLIRSNGLFSGLIFAYDLILQLNHLRRGRIDFYRGRSMACLVFGGSLIGMAMVAPQWLAYSEFCSAGGSPPRPWCTHMIPSIYGWVQNHYWNVGFLRYWILSNLPLFLLAAPTLCLLIHSSLKYLLVIDEPRTAAAERDIIKSKQETYRPNTHSFDVACMRRLAMPQLVLAVLALTNFHVQIINRIASGYPLWYLVIADGVAERNSLRVFGRTVGLSKAAVFLMVMYALIQAGLYASFLPPA